MRVLICGGRHYSDKKAVYDFLDMMHTTYTITLLIEGGATGADMIANQWARERRVKFHTEQAKWEQYKRAAGPIRNNEMLMKNPQVVIAFPGGIGTKNMMNQAKNLGIEVIDIAKDFS